MSLVTFTAGQTLPAADLNANFAEVNKAMTAYFMTPVYPLSNISNLTTNVNTTGYVGMFYIPCPITVNTIHIYVSTYTATGTVKLGVYSEDGQTQYFNVTTSTITAVGLKSVTVTTTLLPRGTYYIVAVPTGTTDIQIRAAFSDADAVMTNPTGKKVTSGTLTVTAETLPTTFTPTTITATQNAPFFRLDN